MHILPPLRVRRRSHQRKLHSPPINLSVLNQGITNMTQLYRMTFLSSRNCSAPAAHLRMATEFLPLHYLTTKFVLVNTSCESCFQSSQHRPRKKLRWS